MTKKLPKARRSGPVKFRNEIRGTIISAGKRQYFLDGELVTETNFTIIEAGDNQEGFIETNKEVKITIERLDNG